MALINALSNSERFLMLMLRQINFAEQNGFPLGIVFACYTLGIALDFLGWYRLAGWYHRYGLSIAEKLQLPSALGTAYNGLQYHELYEGEPGFGLEYGRQSFQASKLTGDIIALSLPAAFLAFGLAHLGDLASRSLRARN